MLEIRPRLAVWSSAAVFVALLLAACTPVNTTQSLAGSSQYDGTLGGSVTIRTRAAVAPGARVVVGLVDRSAPDAPLAEQTLVTQGGQPPYPFLLAYDAQGIDPDKRYGVVAKIYEGDEVTYSTSQPVPVLTFGASKSRADLALQQGQVLRTPEVPGVMRGGVVYAGSDTLPEGSQVVVELINRSRSPLQVVASQRVNADGKAQPIPFRLEYDPASIDDADVYALAARVVVNGLVRYLMVQPVNVLTGGAPADNLELALRPADETTAAAAAAARGAVVSGVVDLGITEPVPAGTVIEVEIVDTAQPDVLFARQQIKAAGLENPVPFTVPLVKEVQEGATYTIQGRVLVNGALAYKQRPPQTVLASGTAESSVYLDASKPPPPPLTGTITGTVSFSEDIPLPIDAYGVIELYYEEGGLPVMTAQQLFFPEAGKPPFDVILYYPVDVIDRSVPHTVNARILVGAMNWFAGPGVPVLYGDEPIMSGADIRLTATQELLQQLADEAAAATEIAATAIAEALPTDEPTVEATPEAEAEADATLQPPAAPEADAGEVPGEAAPIATPQGVAATPLEEGEYLLVLGTLLLPTDDDLPAGAVAKVQMLDVSTLPFTLVTEQAVDAGEGPPPIPFDLAVPVDAATDLGAYALDARIVVDGNVLWQATGLTPLLGEDGPRTDLEVELEAADAGLTEPSFATPGPRPTATATPESTPVPLETATPVEAPTDQPSAMPEATGEPAATSMPAAPPAAPSAAPPAAMPTPPAAAPSSPAGEVTGVVRAARTNLLPTGALVAAQLRKGAGATAEIVAETSERVVSAGGPVTFALAYAAGVIDDTAAYSVAVRVTLNGSPLWLTGRGFPVLTQGAPSSIEVVIR